jgi:hypothetical protein
MIFYFDRRTGKRVSESTWKRSKARGGSRFVRRNSEPRQPKNPAKTGKDLAGKATPVDSAGSGAPIPSQNPRTYQEWKDYFQKLPKRTLRRLEDEDLYDGPEYETGVDY